MKRTLLFTAISLLLICLHTNLVAQTEKKVLIKTNYGNITIKLYNETPIHRDNFLKLVKEKYYDGILFHRVINQFMIQAGDPNSRNALPDAQLGSGGPGYTLPAEISPKYFHKYGVLSAARIGDNVNPQRRSSGSQFYIVQGKTYTIQELTALESRLNTKWTEEQINAYTTIGGTPHLDAQYTVFGEVIEGFDVLNKIAGVKTGVGDRPIEDVKILEMTILN
jgi:cyclophilin family peptidyl-prolyl cis-trans isomerase